MKLVPLFASLALTGIAAFLLGLAFNVQALASFAFATSALFLLIVAGDYAPQRRYRRARIANVVPFAPQPARPVANKLAA